MEPIIERNNGQRAWERVKLNNGAPGSDGMSWDDFPAYAREHWSEIRQSLRDGRYSPRPVQRAVMPKPQGKGERKLGVPCILDRVIQQTILQIQCYLHGFMNRPLRARMIGGVGGEGETPSSIRLYAVFTYASCHWT